MDARCFRCRYCFAIDNPQRSSDDDTKLCLVIEHINMLYPFSSGVVCAKFAHTNSSCNSFILNTSYFNFHRVDHK